MAEPPLLYRELGKKQRMIRGALTAFTLYHVVAMLIGGTINDIKRPVAVVFQAYDEGFRMTNSWGMFGKPPTTTHVLLEAEKADGTKILLSTTRAGDRTWFERLRDLRIRKIQSKLTENDDRVRWGTAYLDYFCRLARAEYGPDVKAVRATEQIHETKDRADKVTRKASTQLLVSKDCAAGRRSGVSSPLRTLPGPVRVPSEL